MRTAPTVKTLQERLRITKDVATRLRAQIVRWRDAPENRRDDAADAALRIANVHLGGHGIETIRNPDDWDNYYGDSIALYVNRGDTYDPTLVYDLRNESWYVGSWGDWWESQSNS